MLTTEVNSLPKKENPIYNDIKKKKHGFIKIRITF